MFDFFWKGGKCSWLENFLSLLKFMKKDHKDQMTD